MRPLRRPSDLFDRTFRIVAIAFAALLPIFFIPVAWVTVPQAKLLLITIAALIASLAWLWALYKERRPRTKSAWLMLVLLALPIGYTISALFSRVGPNGYVSGAGDQDTAASMWLLFTVALIPFFAFDDADEAALTIIRAFIGGFLALLLLQILHLLAPALLLGIFSTPPTSAFGSWHDFGIGCGLVVFFAIALAARERLSPLWNALIAMAGVLSGFMLFVVNLPDIFFTLSGLLIMYAVTQFIEARRIRSAVPIRSMVSAGIAALFFAAGFAGPLIYNHAPAMLKVYQMDVQPSWGMTYSVGAQGFHSIRTALVGAGPHTFDRLWSLYKPAAVNTSPYWNGSFHAGSGFVPTAFATIGAVGILAWIAALGALMYSIVRLIGLSDRSAIMRSIVAFATVYLIVFHLLYVPSIALSAIAFLCIGLVALAGVGASQYAPRRTNSWANARTAGLIACALVIVISGFYTIRADISSMLVNRGGIAFSEGALDEATSDVHAALRIYPQNDAAERAAVSVGIAQLQAIAVAGERDSAASSVLQSTISSTVAHALAAVQIESADYFNWLMVAGLYSQLGGAGVAGAYENAKTAYQRAHENDPSNPVPLLSLATIAYNEHATSTAIGYVNQAIALKSDFPDAFIERAQIEVDMQQFADAERDALEATEIAKSDGSAWYALGSVYYAEGKYQSAIQALDNAQSLLGQDPAISYLLGLSYERIGNAGAALGFLDPLAQANPTNSELQKIVQNLKAAASSTPPSHIPKKP